MTSDEESWFSEGKTAFHTGDLQRAIDSFYAVVEANDQHHLAWNALGVIYSRVHEYEDADICFRNALTLMPDNPIYLQNRGRNNKKIKVLWEQSDMMKKPVRIPYLWIIIGVVGVILLVIIISLIGFFR
jgi:tetratricopeptide (TPR) repeat protein